MGKNYLPIIIIGTAGAAKDAYYWIKASIKDGNTKNMDVIGFIAKEASIVGDDFVDGKKVIGCDNSIGEIIGKYNKIGVIVPFGDHILRKRIVEMMNSYSNVVFPNIIHPSVIFDEEAGTIGIGNSIGPGVILESKYTIGDFNYISGAVQLGHDIEIGNFNSFNPSASVAGNVKFNNMCTLGINATVIQELEVCDDVMIGAGAVVTESIIEAGTYVGIPAKKIK